MAFYRCSSGGGTLTETVLWTNSDTTTQFVSGDVTLSESMQNYKYLKFVFKSATTANALKSVIYPVEEFTYTNVSNSWCRASSPMRSNSSGTNYVRGLIYKSDTSINISNATAFNATGNSNTLAIPYQIIGLN